MLVSVVVDPACFSPQELDTPEALSGAECLLEAASENALIIAPSIDPFVAELIDYVTRLDTRTGQLLQLGAAELAKVPAHVVVAPPAGTLITVSNDEVGLRKVARMMHADALVFRSDVALGDHVDLARLGIEICHIGQYRMSQTERREERGGRGNASTHCPLQKAGSFWAAR